MLDRSSHPSDASAAEGLDRVGGRGASGEGLPVRVTGACPSADLGGSSKRSSENLEDCSGEGFCVNGNRTQVSRS